MEASTIKMIMEVESKPGHYIYKDPQHIIAMLSQDTDIEALACVLKDFTNTYQISKIVGSVLLWIMLNKEEEVNKFVDAYGDVKIIKKALKNLSGLKQYVPGVHIQGPKEGEVI
jgi:hypothetical protein